MKGKHSKRLKKLSVRAIFERSRLPWNKLKIYRDGGVILKFEYPLVPKFFLRSAKEDLATGTIRGLVNALSNAKRAIDCQTDSFLSALGYSPWRLREQLGKPVVESLRLFSTNTEQPLKFRVLESLGIVTPAIVSRIRRVRNLLEHEYKKPSARAVQEAIDVASLYVSACEGAMNTFLEGVRFGFGAVLDPFSGETVLERRISINFDNGNETSLVEFTYADWTKREHGRINVPPLDTNYLALLRILFAARAEEKVEEAIAFAVTNSGHSLDGTSVRVTEINWFG
jgi:hypothetical protein